MESYSQPGNAGGQEPGRAELPPQMVEALLELRQVVEQLRDALERFAALNVARLELRERLLREEGLLEWPG